MEIGKFIYPAFTACSFTYLVGAIDKSELIMNNNSLRFATVMYVIALVLNAMFTFGYYISNDKRNYDNSVNKYWVVRRFNGLSQWSFIFGTTALIYFIAEPLVSVM